MADTREMTPIEQIKRNRVNMDIGLKNLKRLNARLDRGDGAREVALAKTKLEEARMWLGKALGALGRKLPEAFRDEAK